ncbi:hypothetical protein ACFPVX_24170 [Cohnella faecalis]|uniref:Uncharacterized protein n=1 Tax=Cohnella faecalis TaxID=2315694 RepID=A0A398CTL0_9BACL|nr:hypothetical protein [Cohnella faecalis]RIE02651.1 hypothetical protein D3H35_18405 [Cohnella faecalis]
MSKALFWGVTIAIAFIVWYEWKNVRKLTSKDKAVFVSLLFAGWIMTFFDLPHMPGLVSFFDLLFKPLRPLAEK